MYSGNLSQGNVNLDCSLMDNQSDRLGRAETIFPNDAPKQILKVEGAPQGAYTATVAFGVNFEGRINPMPAITQPRTSFLIGLLVWGAGGTTFKVEFDLRNGTLITVPSCYFEIKASFNQDLAKPSNTLADVPVPIEFLKSAILNAGITWGTRAGTSNPTRTHSIEFDPEILPTTGLVPIPNFAHTSWIYVGEGVDYANLDVNFLGGTDIRDGIIGQTTGAVYEDALITDGVKLPEGARALSVTNLVDTGFIYVAFGLSI